MNTLLEVGLGSAERILGSRFLLAFLLPVVLAAGASWALAMAAADASPGDALRAWQDFSASSQLMAALWSVLSLVGAAYLLALFHLPFLRLLEGYWPETALLDGLRERRTERHRRAAEERWRQVAELHAKQEHTRASALAGELAARYPPRPHLNDGALPTALGNRLRAMEFYPLDRYGIDAVVIWPRLVPLLPPEATARVTSARTSLDVAVTLLGLSAVFGAAWPLVLLALEGPGALAALPLLAWPLAWGAHRAALQAATAYGQEVAVVFDLHRTALPRHLGFTVPAGQAEERRMWDDLAQFYLRNLPLPNRSAGGGASAA
ncbi:hypothetical protein O4J56_27380 [Nocardiopsis sp. RSe5-2]|uniref:Uncharacterized protein n=1 Tax=Nocardiopsis endophytica TaxID=3018445 RepID=A0ABT4UD55_9ACTN|nr:hypothetical protein [Nocardiopsis endophytica]MDA2814399.1 hypothetical protein [Nocardiopsis endophytica]